MRCLFIHLKLGKTWRYNKFKTKLLLITIRQFFKFWNCDISFWKSLNEFCYEWNNIKGWHIGLSHLVKGSDTLEWPDHCDPLHMLNETIVDHSNVCMVWTKWTTLICHITLICHTTLICHILYVQIFDQEEHSNVWHPYTYDFRVLFPFSTYWIFPKIFQILDTKIEFYMDSKVSQIVKVK